MSSAHQTWSSKSYRLPPLDGTARSNAALYAKHGVKEYWLIDPDARTVTVLRLGESAFEVEAIYGEGQTLTSPTLAGFTADLNEIFGAG